MRRNPAAAGQANTAGQKRTTDPLTGMTGSAEIARRRAGAAVGDQHQETGEGQGPGAAEDPYPGSAEGLHREIAGDSLPGHQKGVGENGPGPLPRQRIKP